MSGYTKKGLRLLMIGQLLAVGVVISMYLNWFSFNPQNLPSTNFTVTLFLIPLAIIGLIAGLLSLVGAIFFLMGYKEFGEPHKRFVIYAVIIFVVNIVVMILFTTFTALFTYSVASQSIFSQNPTFSTDSINNILGMALITSPLMTLLGGLIWVFGLYHLENRKGRIVLFSAYFCMIAVAIITSISSYLMFTGWMNAGYFDSIANGGSSIHSQYSQLFSSAQWLGATGVISLIGLCLQNTLFFFALYIPYQRITSGELVATGGNVFSSLSDSSLNAQQRRCPACGRSIPFDALVCPYCGKKYDSY